MLRSDYKSQTFDNLADNRTPPADVAEAGLCLSSTLPIQSNMVRGEGLQPSRNPPSAVLLNDSALPRCLPELPSPGG